MKLNKIDIPMRTDAYGTNFFVEKDKEISIINQTEEDKLKFGLSCKLKTILEDNILKMIVDIEVIKDVKYDRVGIRLGIDTYMEKYPTWNQNFFPTALRCENNGFWGCFCSPKNDMLGIASPSNIVSWSNEYNESRCDVGHRIYTSSLDFVNIFSLPDRHIQKSELNIGEKLHYEIFLSIVESKESLYEFVEKYTEIVIPRINCFVLEKSNTDLDYFRHIISKGKEAETSVYVRKDWFYYLDMARLSAEKCQQKVGTNSESWYGYFTLVAYAKKIKDKDYTAKLVKKFDYFFAALTKGRKKRFKKLAMPYRLQNISCMLSLLADMYQLTLDIKYLNFADDLADWLMSLQHSDGSYRSHGTHYTCVIYPAKSMIELALVEAECGLYERYTKHYNSAYKAIQNLYVLMDNIETEGEMTFEDGMISCEALQLGYLALFCTGEERENLTKACEAILKKHKCLEQFLIPDCRTHGATLRFWEARYDINFKANMLNTPHGWTSWKTYGTYYAYVLTGKLEYLIDTINTIGACMQVIDNKGILNWAFIPDPCIRGNQMQKSTKKEGYKFAAVTIGEQYLPMVSDWFRHKENKLTFQYLLSFDNPKTWKRDYGGSCDNDVHEHFKCLDETVFGKGFIHFDDNGVVTLFNACLKEDIFSSLDTFVADYIVRAAKKSEININGKIYTLKPGINMINVAK